MLKIGITKSGRIIVLICFLFILPLLSISPSVRADPVGIYPLFLPLVSNFDKVNWIGPEGGHIIAVEINPENALNLYAGTWGSGMYRSDDGGFTWRLINSGLDNLYIYSLAIDPGSTNTIYAGTYGDGVYKSVDGGMIWSQTGPGLNQDAIVYAIAIDP